MLAPQVCPHGTAPTSEVFINNEEKIALWANSGHTEASEMEYTEKLKRIDEHLKNNPKDYQSVIARMKIYSDAVEHELYKKRIYRLKRIAEVKRQLKEMGEQ